jgi:hypothetical protein
MCFEKINFIFQHMLLTSYFLLLFFTTEELRAISGAVRCVKLSRNVPVELKH